MQTKLTGLHLFAGKLSLFALHFVGAEQSPAPTERIPKAPLAGADSPYQGEMSRRDKRGRDAGAAKPRLRGCRRFATAVASGGPFFSVLPEKKGEKRGAWLRFGAFCL